MWKINKRTDLYVNAHNKPELLLVAENLKNNKESAWDICNRADQQTSEVVDLLVSL